MVSLNRQSVRDVIKKKAMEKNSAMEVLFFYTFLSIHRFLSLFFVCDIVHYGKADFTHSGSLSAYCCLNVCLTHIVTVCQKVSVKLKSIARHYLTAELEVTDTCEHTKLASVFGH